MSAQDDGTAERPRLGVDWWREVTAFRPHNAAHWGSLRAAVAVATPIAILSSAGHVDWTAYAVFGAFAGVFGRHNTYAARFRIQAGVAALLTLAIVLGTAAGVVAPGSFVAVGVMTLLSAVGYLAARRFGWLPVPALFLVFAAGSVSSYRHAASDLVPAVVLPIVAALFAIGLGQIGRWFPQDGRAKAGHPTTTPFRDLFRAPGVRVDLLRYVLGPLVAGGVATAIGIGHPYWAAVSATVPLAGTTFAAQIGRGSLRLGGTIVGIGVAFAVLAFDPPTVVLIVGVMVFQFLAELFVMRNYGLTVMAVTPLALIMGHLAAPVPLGTLLSDRLVETVLGVVTVVVVLLVVRPYRRRAGLGES